MTTRRPVPGREPQLGPNRERNNGGPPVDTSSPADGGGAVSRSRTPIALATALALVLVGLTAGPVSAGVKRYPSLEKFALRLVNCTRTGGWVKADGSCKGFGSGRFSKYREPLKFHPGIADAIAFPWARRIAKANYCGHTLAGSSVDGRFRKAGFKNRHNGENVGCSYAWSAKKMVIRTHRMMQSEKSWNGWHWRQMKDPDFRSAGIGVVKVNRKTRIVVDFYGRRP